jgi:hypothetical protein
MRTLRILCALVALSAPTAAFGDDVPDVGAIVCVTCSTSSEPTDRGNWEGPETPVGPSPQQREFERWDTEGYDLYEKARQATDFKSKDQFLSRAYDAYQAALRVNPNDAATQSNSQVVYATLILLRQPNNFVWLKKALKSIRSANAITRNKYRDDEKDIVLQYCRASDNDLAARVNHGLGGSTGVGSSSGLRNYIYQTRVIYQNNLNNADVQCNDTGSALERNLGTCNQPDENAYQSCIKAIYQGYIFEIVDKSAQCSGPMGSPCRRP